MRKAGIAEMYVVVNHAGQQPLTVGIDYGIGLRSLIGQVDASSLTVMASLMRVLLIMLVVLRAFGDTCGTSWIS